MRAKDPVRGGHESVAAASKACEERDFARARELAAVAHAAFAGAGRSDLLGEVRLLTDSIARVERSVTLHKQRIEGRVRTMLDDVHARAAELDCAAASALLSDGAKLMEREGIPLKGRIKRAFRAAAEALLCAEHAIEGDKLLAQAWDQVQRDELDAAAVSLLSLPSVLTGHVSSLLPY